MKQPIAGVAPSSRAEVTVMTVWPSICRTAYGRFWGRCYKNRTGFKIYGVPLTLGWLIAIFSIPFILPLWIHMKIPRLPLIVFGFNNPSCRRYRLTNRRILVENGVTGEEQKSVALDRFDTIQIEVLDGQQWYNAGDLVFLQGGTETFRLEGVPRPETFRHTCGKAHMSFVGVQQARQAGMAV